jgi:23S rRNA (cytidine1920-2'-O)/16S rRNA (cytidine1409-2'-O)-methyltransferase
MSQGRRADVALVEGGFFESRARAQEAIAAGLVEVDGKPLSKASASVPPGASIRAAAPHPWVSRGGVKLAAALDAFGYDPSGLLCLDIGSSTGGFSHVLLSRGAARIVAVDVGRNQFHESLRGHPAVDLREETDARALRPEHLPGAPALVTFDVSFIPLRLVLGPVLALAAPGARAIALVKPQFEAGRQHLKKGIVRDAAIQEQAGRDVAAECERLGWRVDGTMPSPIEGGDGNREFLLACVRETTS